MMAKSYKEFRKDLIREGHVDELSLMIAGVKLVFAEAFYQLREKHNMTQAQLAKAIGVSQPYIARIEDGEENLTIETMAKLLFALKSQFKFFAEDHKKKESLMQFLKV
jgi:transcriptional regulator with XRE-family HTH domain